MRRFFAPTGSVGRITVESHALEQREVFPMGFVVSAPSARRFFALATTTSSLVICLVIGAATSAMAQAGGGAVYAMTYLDVSTDWVLQGAGLMKQYRDTSRREAGNLEFTVLQETTRPNRFAIVEGWRDQKSMDAHAKGADAKRFGFILAAIRNSPPDQHVLEGFAMHQQNRRRQARSI